MAKTLLEKAKETKSASRNIKHSDEEIELALAWARSEITNSQVSNAMNLTGVNVYTFLASRLRSHFSKK